MRNKNLLISSDYPPMKSGIASACYNFWKHLPPGKTVVLAPRLKGGKQYDLETEIKCYRYFPAFTGISIFSKLLRSATILIFTLYIIFKEKITYLLLTKSTAEIFLRYLEN